jgi:hypothetical protein
LFRSTISRQNQHKKNSKEMNKDLTSRNNNDNDTKAKKKKKNAKFEHERMREREREKEEKRQLLNSSFVFCCFYFFLFCIFSSFEFIVETMIEKERRKKNDDSYMYTYQSKKKSHWNTYTNKYLRVSTIRSTICICFYFVSFEQTMLSIE